MKRDPILHCPSCVYARPTKGGKILYCTLLELIVNRRMVCDEYKQNDKK